MKLRSDFVTNSSSYSSCVIRVDNPVLFDILSKYKDSHHIVDGDRDSSTLVCSNGLAVSRENGERAGISYAPDSLSAVLDALENLLNNTWIDEKEAERTGLYNEMSEHKDEILKSFQEVTWFVSLDYNNEDPSPSKHGTRIFKWPKRLPDLQDNTSGELDPESFSYENIDRYSSSFYSDLANNLSGWPVKDAKYKIKTDGGDVTVSFKVEKLLADVKNYFCGILSGNDQDLFLYDPAEIENNSLSLGVTPELPISVVRHRVLMFSKIVLQSVSEQNAELIACNAKKKKDKTLFINRTLPIATLLVVDQSRESFVFYAKNTKSNVIEVFGRKAFAFDRDRSQDLIISTNLLKRT